MAPPSVTMSLTSAQFDNASKSAGLKVTAGIAGLESLTVVDAKMHMIEKMMLPVVDLGVLGSGDPADRARIVKEVGKATEEWGFFQVVNHGIPDELVMKVHDQARQFFNKPMDVKRLAEFVGPNPRHLGYRGIFAKDAKINNRTLLKESLADFYTNSNPVSLPTIENSIFGDTLQEHCNSAETLGHQILELLAESVGLERTFFSQHFAQGSDSVGSWRLHYFPSNPPSDERGAYAHSDPSVLTILKQHDAGLQIKKPGGNWFDIHVLPGSYVINVGDVLEAWSNGRFPSVEHRIVLSSDRERLSTVNFLDAGPTTVIEAPPELIDEDHPSIFRRFLGSEYRENFEKIWRLGDISKGNALQYVRRHRQVKS